MKTRREPLNITLTPDGRRLLGQLARTHGQSRSALIEFLIRDKARNYDRDHPNWRQDATTKEQEATS